MEVDQIGTPDPSEIPKITAEVLSPIPETRLEAVRKIRHLLSLEVRPPIQEVIESGILPELVSFLGNDEDSTLQFEAAWSLTNVGSGTSEQTKALVDAKAIPGFVHLLSSRRGELREQAVWALGNIAGDCTAFRDQILEENAMGRLLHCIITSTQLPLVRNAIWAVSNLCRGKPPPSFSMVSPAIPVLALLLSAPNDEMLVDVCWSLSYLSEGGDERVEKLVQSDDMLVPRLVELMDDGNAAIRVPALRTIGNIVTSDNYTRLVLDCPMALPNLKKQLNDNRKTVRKEACWAFSNITAGSAADIQMVIDIGVVPVVMGLVVSEESDFEIRKEALWVLANMFSEGSVDQIVFLVEKGIIPLFFLFLSLPNAHTIIISLECMERILKEGKDTIRFGEKNPFLQKIEECEGFEQLYELQNHPNATVYEKISGILEYFDDEDREEMGDSSRLFS